MDALSRLTVTFPLFGVFAGVGNAQQQWPNAFPYPDDFPALPDSSVNIGAGTGALGNPFIATYKGMGGDQVEYQYHEYTTGEDISRRKIRTTRVNYPNEGLVDTSYNGFTEDFDSTVFNGQQGNGGIYGNSIGQFNIGLSRVTHSYTLATNALGNIEATRVDNEIHTDRHTTVTASSMTVRYRSIYSVGPTHLNPTAPVRAEVIEILFNDDGNEWSVDREYLINGTLSEEKNDGDYWPNSGGQGSETLATFAAVPTLSHTYFGVDYLKPSSPAFYSIKAFIDAPWSQMQW